VAKRRAEDVSNFNATSQSVITVAGKRYTVENANQAWSITNPDTQTIVYQVRPGDVWAGDIGRPEPHERSQIDALNYPFWAPGTEVNVRYNMNITSSTVSTTTTEMNLGEFHNDDVAMGGVHTSPDFEIDLQPQDFMSIYVGYLTASGQQANSVFYGSQIVGGFNISYAQVYADPNPIIRNHNYDMRIQLKYTSAGDNSGFVKVWRD
jgi:hypothetical protein